MGWVVLLRLRARVGAGRAALGLLHEFDCVKFRLYPDSLFHLFGGMIRFGNHSLLTGVWFVAATSLALGNIDIDQAVVSTIADRIAAAKVTLIRMTPTSGSTSLSLIFAPSYRKKCELPHIDRRLFAGSKSAHPPTIRHHQGREKRRARRAANSPSSRAADSRADIRSAVIRRRSAMSCSARSPSSTALNSV